MTSIKKKCSVLELRHLAEVFAPYFDRHVSLWQVSQISKLRLWHLSHNAIKNKIKTIIYKHFCYPKAVEQKKSMKIPNLPILLYIVSCIKASAGRKLLSSLKISFLNAWRVGGIKKSRRFFQANILKNIYVIKSMNDTIFQLSFVK